MIKPTAFIVPYGLNFGPGLCCTSPRTGKVSLRLSGSAKPVLSARYTLVNAAQKTSSHPAAWLGFWQARAGSSLAEKLGALMHALINGFRRHVDVLVHLGHFRRQLREGRFGITPGPEGDHGQKEFARNFGRTFHKTRSPGGGFNVFSSKEFC